MRRLLQAFAGAPFRRAESLSVFWAALSLIGYAATRGVADFLLTAWFVSLSIVLGAVATARGEP